MVRAVVHFTFLVVGSQLGQQLSHNTNDINDIVRSCVKQFKYGELQYSKMYEDLRYSNSNARAGRCARLRLCEKPFDFIIEKRRGKLGHKKINSEILVVYTTQIKGRPSKGHWIFD